MTLRALLAKWGARRAGRANMERSDLSRSVREVVGPTGWMWSGGWDATVRGSSAYVKTFDRRLPTSFFVSERDRHRHNIPIPLVERSLQEVVDDPAEDPKPPRPENPL